MEVGVTMKNIFFILFLFTSLISGKTDRLNSQTRTANVEHVIWDGNQISNIHGNHGDIASYHVNGHSGLEWPKGENTHALFQSGIWIATGKVNNQDSLIASMVYYTSEFVPGINNGSDSSGHIYEIQKAEIDAFLENDWNTFSSMSLPLPTTITEGNNIYTELIETGLPTDDFINWPVEEGAPWHDENDDGVYSPEEGDYPKIKGNMFHWYVMNDYDVDQHYFSNASMGLTIRTSMYGFDAFSPLENTLFIEWEIENTGENELDSVFIGWWADPDLGDHTDDLIGVDTIKNLMYCYNDWDGDFVYGPVPPALGTKFLQPPIVPSMGDTAFIFGMPVPDYKHLELRSHMRYISGNPVFQHPNYIEHVYNNCNGLMWNGNDFIDPTTGEPSRFNVPGNPVTGEGWLDEYPSERSHFMSYGPVSIHPGDKQKVAGAVTISQSSVSNMVSLTKLWEEIDIIQRIWDSQFQLIEDLPRISIYSGPTNQTENEGPYEFIFNIQNADQIDLDLIDIFYVWGEDPQNFLPSPLTQINDSLYSISIPGSEEPQFNYFIDLGYVDGLHIAFPMSAPDNYQSLTLGPDLNPPIITSYDTLFGAYHLLPFKKMISIVDIWDDRFATQTPLLFWEYPDGATDSLEMEIFSNYFDQEIQKTKKSYKAELTGFAGILDSEISYWINVKDSSQNQNVSTTGVHTFPLEAFEAIGNWEVNNLDYWEFDGYPSFLDFAFAGFDFHTILKYRTFDNDTILYNRPLNMTHFDDVWLSNPMVLSLNENKAFVEVTDGLGGWTVLDSFQFDSYEIIVPNHYDLSPFTDQDSLYLRFRLNILTDDYAEWRFDDIFIHNIPEWLDADENTSPTSFALYRPYPNPFNPSTTIQFDIPVETRISTPLNNRVSLRIFDITGRMVETLVDVELEPGTHEIQWHAKNHASGIYFIRMVSGWFVKTQKMILLK